MFFPISTDRRLQRTPWVNYGLIALNVAVYAFTWQSTRQYDRLSGPEGDGYSIQEVFQSAPGVGLWLWPDDESNTNIRLYQFVTYQFVHAGPEPAPVLGVMLPMHLLFNMLFLYVFGNAVEDRLGKAGYLGFYLAGGVLAGLAHMLTGGGPVLGASGSVAAVTGIYLALFPLSNVTIAYWMVVFVGSFVVSSMVLIVFRVVLDVIFQFSGYGNTAYVAHLAGYLYGFVLGMGFLLARLVPREPYDLLAMIQRRARYRRFSRQGYSPWDATPAGRGGPARPAETQPSPEDEALMRRRAEITQAIGAQDLPLAAARYTRLLEDHPQQAMSSAVQLDLATQLASDGDYPAAARAYELFLDAYRQDHQQPQVQLLLGLIYANYLDRPDRARPLLESAVAGVDGDEKALAQATLKRLA